MVDMVAIFYMCRYSKECGTSPRSCDEKDRMEERGTKRCLATRKEIRCRDVSAIVAKKMLST